MARRETAAVREGTLVFEPRIPEITPARYIAGHEPASSLLHHEADELRIDKGFGSEQAGVLRFGTVARETRDIENGRGEGDSKGGITSAKGPGLIGVEGGAIPEERFGVRVENDESGGADRDCENGLPVAAADDLTRECEDRLLLPQNLERELLERDGCFRA